MFDELTKVDIKKLQDELEYRIGTVRPKILEEVKFTRSFGDLSENAEYHAAKRERGKNESRIRYIRNMLRQFTDSYCRRRETAMWQKN